MPATTGCSGTALGDQRLGWPSNAPELLDALRAGRVWFSDPAAWQGVMEISAQGDVAMGGVLVSPDALVPLK